ncbi:hypothetical protein OG21DRAFT_1528289 [Imleria badia]|nr:hypothetical protein OG21DRAFT_1528289 [Imleria badia]
MRRTESEGGRKGIRIGVRRQIGDGRGEVVSDDNGGVMVLAVGSSETWNSGDGESDRGEMENERIDTWGKGDVGGSEVVRDGSRVHSGEGGGGGGVGQVIHSSICGGSDRMVIQDGVGVGKSGSGGVSVGRWAVGLDVGFNVGGGGDVSSGFGVSDIVVDAVSLRIGDGDVIRVGIGLGGGGESSWNGRAERYHDSVRVVDGGRLRIGGEGDGNMVGVGLHSVVEGDGDGDNPVVGVLMMVVQTDASHPGYSPMSASTKDVQSCDGAVASGSISQNSDSSSQHSGW